MGIPEKEEREAIWQHASLKEKSKYFYDEVWPFVEMIDNSNPNITEKSELYFDICPMSGTISYTVTLKDRVLFVLATPFWDFSYDGIPIQISDDKTGDITEEYLKCKDMWVLPYKLTGKPIVDAATYITKIKGIVQAIFGGEL